MTETVPERLTADAMFNSLTGFDELAIKAKFGVTISTLSGAGKQEGDPMQFLRALVYVAERREGKSDHDAFHAAQDLSMGAVTAYFPDATPDIDPDNPETEQGKELAATT